MKAHCLSWSTFVLMALSCIGLCSCGDDENETDERPVETALEAVDLGLSVKWANMNVGAKSPESTGGRYAWGEVSEKETYTMNNYQSPGISSIGGSQYDVATKVMGGSWRMPTEQEMKELITNCTLEIIAINGTKCGKFTASNGKSILLPIAGWKGLTISGEDNGAYWVSTGSGKKGLLFLNKSFKQIYDSYSPEAGMLVRAVME